MTPNKARIRGLNSGAGDLAARTRPSIPSDEEQTRARNVMEDKDTPS